MKEMGEEIRKLKTLIVKHEGRIRVLESAAQLAEKEKDKKDHHTPDKDLLASDEV